MRLAAPTALTVLLTFTSPAVADGPERPPHDRTDEPRASTHNFAASGFAAPAREKRRSAASTPGGVASRPKGGADARMAMRRAKYMPIARAVKPAGLPVALVDAVITKESRYVPTVRGSLGEVGLMQIRPSTARHLAKENGMSDAAKLSHAAFVKWLQEPRNNLRLGLIYLQMCHDMAKGDVPATIGCYNAGPGNMWRWKGIGVTRSYVEFVNDHMESAVN